MHNLCRQELGLSDVVVKNYVPPDRVWHWLLSGLCLLIFATFPISDQVHDTVKSFCAVRFCRGSLLRVRQDCAQLQNYVKLLNTLDGRGKSVDSPPRLSRTGPKCVYKAKTRAL